MSSTYNSRIITKTDTYDNWTAANPVLLNGELVAVTGHKYNGTDDLGVLFKFGDGVTAFNSLPFVDQEIINAVYRLTELCTTDHEILQQSVVVYVGTTAPASDVGNDGDLYVQLG